MKYEYMKEYECNGLRPNLSDDVLVQGEYAGIKIDCASQVRVDCAYWEGISKFRIVDERYKPSDEQDTVRNPKHYQFFDGVEAIDIIASSMSIEEFRGFCMGNKLKYCLRAGKKGDAAEDLRKADMYDELFEQKRHLCGLTT